MFLVKTNNTTQPTVNDCTWQRHAQGKGAV